MQILLPNNTKWDVAKMYFKVKRIFPCCIWHYSIKDFITPLSIKLLKTFLNIINRIGPINIPSTPINLNPVYIAIIVNIGCIPIFPLTILGSINCLVMLIVINKTIIDTPKVNSPLNPEIIAQGIITDPAPKIGSASTNPIPSAASNG